MAPPVAGSVYVGDRRSEHFVYCLARAKLTRHDTNGGAGEDSCADLKQIPWVEATYQRIFWPHRPASTVIVNNVLPVGVLVESEAVAAVAVASEPAYRS